MGNPHYSDDVGKMCWNGAKSWQIGWYDDRKIMINPKQAGFSNWVGRLIGVANYDSAGDEPVVVKIETGTGADQFIAFNRKTGVNSHNVQASNEVTIVEVTGNDGEGYAQSFLKANLIEGQSYSYTNWAGTGRNLIVKVNTINIAANPGYAEIQVCLDSCAQVGQMIRSMANPTLCIDVSYGRTHNGNPLHLWPCQQNNRAQQFYFDNGFIRTVLNPNKCIEAGQDGNHNLYTFDCNYGDNDEHRKWELKKDGRIQNLKHKKYLAVQDCDVKNAQLMGARNYETDNLCQSSQMWKVSDNLEPIGQMIRSMANPTLCVDVSYGRTHNGNPLHLWPCQQDNRGQQFYFDNGFIRTVLNPNKCIEAGQDGNHNLYTFDCNYGDNDEHRKWELKKDGRIQNLKHKKYLAVQDCDVKNAQLMGARNYETDNLCQSSQMWKVS